MLATKINLIVYNVRSAHNVGSILRTADGLGVHKVYLVGYTPYPHYKNDKRLPHLAQKINQKIAKTALGAEKNNFWEHHEEAKALITNLKEDGWTITAIEQAKTASLLHQYIPSKKICLILGNELAGIESKILKFCDEIVQIPMLGKKESFNVVEAGTMALYHCRFFTS